jgi:hypothetical protein
VFADIEEIIVVILSQNGRYQGHLRARSDSVQEVATVSMNEPDKGINLVIFNADGLLMNDHQMEVFQN